jgi:hypothetical protein
MDKNTDKQHVLVHAAYPCPCCMPMSMLHVLDMYIYSMHMDMYTCGDINIKVDMDMENEH